MPEIDPQRLMNDLRHLRTIGKHGTGVVRPAFSTKDMAARQWLLDRMKEAGLEATMDGTVQEYLAAAGESGMTRSARPGPKHGGFADPGRSFGGRR